MKIYKTVEDVQDASDEEIEALQQRYIKKLEETDDEILDLTELDLGIYKLIDKKIIPDEITEDMDEDDIEYHSQRGHEVFLYAPENKSGGQLEIAIERFADPNDDDFYNSPSNILDGWYHPVCLKLLSLGTVEIYQPDGTTGYVNRYTGIFRQFKNIE
ncbi:MAG: hypothetical protein ACI4VQ_05805, partial [Clostridia bacterium]